MTQTQFNSNQIPGYRLIKTTTLTTGTAQPYTFDPRTTAYLIEVIGATGGGGGVDGQGAGTIAIGEAGGNCSFARSFNLITPGEIFTSTIGAGGIGGAAGANNGTAGGTTSFTGSVFGTIQVTGGAGGLGRTANAIGAYLQGEPGTPSGGNLLNLLGGRALSGRWANGDTYTFPNNGSPLFGAGKTMVVVGDGSVGALGAGGLGGFAFFETSNYAGGNGFPGQITVSEYTGGI